MNTVRDKEMRPKLYLLLLVSLLLVSCGKHVAIEEPKYEWNNGYCSECHGRLDYDKTGSKEHYICERCGKEYTFDKIMIRED